MAGQELMGGYAVRREHISPEEERWRTLIKEVEAAVAEFPVDLLGDDDVRDEVTADGETLSVFYLDVFRKLAVSGDEPTSLFIGTVEEARDRHLYEYGRSPISLDEDGNAIKDNPIALRLLNLEALTSAELEWVRGVLRWYVASP